MNASSRRFPVVRALLGVLVVLSVFPGVVMTGARAANDPYASSAYLTVSSPQLAEMLRSKDFFFVNVHVPYEGEISGTDAQIPFDRISERLASFPPDKNAKVVLYCMSGRMSAIAAQELTRLGYTDVSHLSGVMIAWEAAGYALVK